MTEHRTAEPAIADQSGRRGATSLRVAGPERRFYAFVLDRLVAWSLVAGACWAAYALFWTRERLWPGAALLTGVVVLLWVANAVALGLAGTTPGKAAVGLRAVHHGTRTPVGVGRALLRGLVLGAASVPTLGIGLATLAWTALTDRDHQRRGWHDRVARTIVVDVRRGLVPTVAGDSGPRHVVNLTAMRLVPAPARPTAPQASRRPTGAPVPAARSPGQAWVLAFDTGERVPVDGLVLVGRRPEAGPGESVRHLVVLPSQDMSLSKTHAQVRVAGDGALVVMDRGSTNGSVLTRQGVSRPLAGGKPATLLEGDVVRLGDRSMAVSRQA